MMGTPSVPSTDIIPSSTRTFTQSDDIEKILCKKFMGFLAMRADSFFILRRKPVAVCIVLSSDLLYFPLRRALTLHVIFALTWINVLCSFHSGYLLHLRFSRCIGYLRLSRYLNWRHARASSYRSAVQLHCVWFFMTLIYYKLLCEPYEQLLYVHAHAVLFMNCFRDTTLASSSQTSTQSNWSSTSLSTLSSK
jgi:hypothetical protein